MARASPKELWRAMRIESQRETAGCGKRFEKDQQKRASAGIGGQELGNK